MTGGPTEAHALYPQKSLFVVAYPKKSLDVFGSANFITYLLESDSKKILGSFIDPKTDSLLSKISGPKNLSDPPVFIIWKWAPLRPFIEQYTFLVALDLRDDVKIFKLELFKLRSLVSFFLYYTISLLFIILYRFIFQINPFQLNTDLPTHSSIHLFYFLLSASLYVCLFHSLICTSLFISSVLQM